jgi:hypothetical protein
MERSGSTALEARAALLSSPTRAASGAITTNMPPIDQGLKQNISSSLLESVRIAQDRAKA